MGRLLISQPVDRAVGRFRLSRTMLHILLGVAVVGLIGFTMMEFGPVAIHLNFADPIGQSDAYMKAVLGVRDPVRFFAIRYPYEICHDVPLLAAVIRSYCPPLSAPSLADYV
jgi:hypothetical protein